MTKVSMVDLYESEAVHMGLIQSNEVPSFPSVNLSKLYSQIRSQEAYYHFPIQG